MWLRGHMEGFESHKNYVAEMDTKNQVVNSILSNKKGFPNITKYLSYMNCVIYNFKLCIRNIVFILSLVCFYTYKQIFLRVASALSLNFEHKKPGLAR